MSVSQENVARQFVNVAKTILFSAFFQEKFLLILTRLLDDSEKSATHTQRKKHLHIKSHSDKTEENHIDIKKKLSINKSRKNIAITKVITQSNQSAKRIKCVCAS
jgi:hypothetical protein